ncbi:MAG TPA: hypothetical protein VG871_01540 [Vicinamibacterales bacterium]|nr:hypothetical protein [Vicinamibacterales bacterium]
MALLTWLESLRIAVWVHESPSVWAQPTVMTFHTMGMGVVVGASWMLDLRLLGVGANVPLSTFRWVFKAVAIALTVNVITGVLLFAARATMWGTAIPFLVKMLFVVGSAATVLPLRKYVLNSSPDQREISGNARLLAIASIVAWAGAITSGRLLAYLVAG